MKIAVLITCYNRKVKTLSCLESLFIAYKKALNLNISISVYLTDDGSTDGTSEAVLKEFSDYDIHILRGTGNLFWAGGMRNSWKKAINDGGFNGYLWLNDDSSVVDNLFFQLLEANEYSRSKFGQEGIYVGSTYDSVSKKFTYGGSILLSKIFFTFKYLVPNGSFQSCQFGNGNILYVSNKVVDQIGVIHKGYTHGVGDYDYTYLAYTKNIPIFILKSFSGVCERDHYVDKNDHFSKLKISERIKYLYSPLGLQFNANLLLQKRFFIWRYPFVFFIGWVKVFLPNLYIIMNKFR